MSGEVTGEVNGEVNGEVSKNMNSVMIVDDDVAEIRVLVDILSRDYVVYAERDSLKSLDVVKKLQPDLILLDIMMPEMSGFEVIKHLKEDRDTKDIPVIFVTGLDDSNDEVLGFFLGAVDYINKPFSAPVVKMRVKNQMKIINQMHKIQSLHEAEKIERQRKEQERLKKERLKYLEESIKAKDKFLAKMSHEIRTPISAVLSISEVQLRSEVMPPQTEEAFARIYNSSKTLLNIVNDILDFSKIEAGKMTLIDNEYEIASLVSDAAQLRLVYLENKDVSFKVYVDENLPTKLIGDVLRIRQIMNNMLSNAFKYTESGTVTLSLQCEKERDGYVTIVMSVQDTGSGMTEEQIKAIKEEYVRLHEKDTPYSTGTGLGIPIAYSLVQMMGAQLDFSSSVGKGTCVTIRIPQKISDGGSRLGPELARKLQDFEFSEREVAKDLKFVSESMPYGRVLVVDDLLTNLYVAEMMLKSFDLDIELCESGQEAIDKIKQGEVYDIIFMDHMMPDMDGIKATKILRNMGYVHPIVALTANAVKGQAEVFMNNGFSGAMIKPIDINLLKAYLDRFIKNKKETYNL